MLRYFSWASVLTFLGSLLTAWATYHFRSRNKQRLRERWVLAGVIVASGGGLLASFEQAAHEQQIVDMTSGGDSFCHVVFLFPSDLQNKPQLGITLVGKNPLHNLHVVIRDVDRLRAALPNVTRETEQRRFSSSEEIENFDKLSTQISIPSLGPSGTTLRVKGFEFPENVDRITYTVNFSTPFQQFDQYLKLRKVNGKWKQAYRVHREDESGKGVVVLQEHVEEGFPPDKGGKVDWSYLLND
jgi:hypothetical protein